MFQGYLAASFVLLHTVTAALSFIDSDHSTFLNVNIPKFQDTVLSEFARKAHILLGGLTIAFLQKNLPWEFLSAEYVR